MKRKYREEGAVFNCGESRLVGITAIPENPNEVGVLILVGGPQYRVGSHRQFTLLARSLAEAGIVSLRFDFTGMGDSEGERRGFDRTGADIEAAIEKLCGAGLGVSRVVLWGLCDGASSAMMFAHAHPRVCSMILLNPWVHTGEYSADVKMAHFYRPSLLKSDQWRRLFTGKINLRPALRELAGDTLTFLRSRLQSDSGESDKYTFVDVMREGLNRFKHKTLIILSEADLTAREFSTLVNQDASWKALISKNTTVTHTITGADHTFSKKPWKEEVAQLTIDWIKNQ